MLYHIIKFGGEKLRERLIGIFLFFTLNCIFLFSKTPISKIRVDFVSTEVFYKPVSIKVYKDRVYVLDAKAYNVKVLSLKGKMIKTFGRKGEGPGEFKRPFFFDIANEKIFVLDGNDRVEVFDVNGRFKTSFSLNTPSFFVFILKNRIVLSDAVIKRGTYKWFSFYDFSGNLIHCKTNNKRNIKENTTWFNIMSNFKAVFKIDNKSIAYVNKYSRKQNYNITIVDYYGKVSRKIDLNKKIFKEIFIKYKGKIIHGIIENGCYYNGYYFLQPFKYNKELNKGKFDIEPSNEIYVFDNEGRFKNRFSFPNSIKIFTYYKDKFFIIDTDYELKIYKQYKLVK
jgi:hypothetical protein